MKKSKSITLTLVPVVAAAFLASCDDQPPPTHQRVCADQDNKVVEDDRCNQPQPSVPYTPHSHAFVYHHYYVPYHEGGYSVGTPLHGGSYAPPAAGRVAVGRSVVRGGFGSTAHSMSGHAGE